MRIEGRNSGEYQPPQAQQKAQPVRMESKPVEKVKVQKPIEKHTEIVNDVALPDEKQTENEHEVIKAIEKANTHIRSFDRRLEFSIHDTTKQIMVKVINTEDDSIIREIPSEKVLDMVAHMWEVAGILVDKKI